MVNKNTFSIRKRQKGYLNGEFHRMEKVKLGKERPWNTQKKRNLQR